MTNVIRIAWITLLTISFLSQTSLFSKSEKEQTIKCPRKVKVTVKKIEAQDITEYKEFSGDLKAQSFPIKVALAGKISEVRVTDGDLVSENWVIAVLGDEFKEEIKTTTEEVEKWKKILWKRQNWKERSPKAEEQAQSKIKENKSKLESLKDKVALCKVKSSMAGQVKGLTVKSGDAVQEGDVIGQVINEKELLLMVPTTREDRQLFSLHQKIKVMAGDMVVKASVKGSEGRNVILKIDNSDKKIPSGTSAKFKLVKAEHKGAILLPKGKIMSDEAGDFIYKAEDKKARKSYIKHLTISEGTQKITYGLYAGDELITSEIKDAKKGVASDELVCLRDNKKIQIMEKNPETNRFVKVKKGKKIKKKKKVAPKEADKSKELLEAKKEEKKRKKAEKEAQKKKAAEEKKRKKLESMESKPSQKIKCPRRVNVQVKEILPRDFSETENFVANLKPEVVQLQSPVAGKITEVRVKPGDYVSQNWEIAVAQTEGENGKTEEYLIKTPVAGVVGDIQIKTDQEIPEGAVIGSVKNEKTMIGMVPVSSGMTYLFLKDQTLTVNVNGNAYQAKVQETTNNQAIIWVGNDKKEIAAGSTMKFQLVKQIHKDIVVLPKQKILSDEAGDYIYVAEEKRAKKSYIKYQMLDQSHAKVTYGLYPGDALIVSEIPNPKSGEVREELVCLRGDKKITLMEKDPETGLFKKVKPVKIKKSQKVEPKAERPTRVKPTKKSGGLKEALHLNSVYLGGQVSFYNMNDENFKNVYANDRNWVGVEVGFETIHKVVVWGGIKSFTNSGTLKYYENNSEVTNGGTTEFKLNSISAGVRYLPKKMGIFTPYIGVGVDFYSFSEEIADAKILTSSSVEESAVGFDINLGTYIRFEYSEYLEANVGVKYTSVKKSFDQSAGYAISEFDMGGFETFLGLSLRF